MKLFMILPAILLGAAQEETATVSGTVKWGAPIPKERPVPGLKDIPDCCRLYEKIPFRDDLVVDAEMNLRWAFVHVKKGLEGRTFKPPAGPVRLDQKGCIYTPHVLGLQGGQEIHITNSDTSNHNVKFTSLFNGEFNPMHFPGIVLKKTMHAPETMARFKCDLHPFMGAWIGIVPHPFFAVTGADGKFEIKGLPPGKYTLEVRHEKAPAVTREIEVKAKEAKALDFTVEPRKE